jgi:hypothetical protein
MICPNCQVKCLRVKQTAWACPKCPFFSEEFTGQMTMTIALVSVDDQEREGIIAYDQGDRIMPAIGSSQNLLGAFEKLAGEFARRGNKCRLLKFTQREVLKEWGFDGISKG